MERHQATARVRKRRADPPENNERLSKRLSLLNIEQDGPKLYVPVETAPTTNGTASRNVSGSAAATPPADDSMRLDDTKHKVYIYNLDDELSDSDSSADEGRLVFLPDIEKHLFRTRIPPSVLRNQDGELAGDQQLVLYNVPSSLSVPEDKDSVRKAIIEARARARGAGSTDAVTKEAPTQDGIPPTATDPDAMDLN